LAVNGTDLLIAAVLIAVASGITYVYSRRMFKQSNADLQNETQEQLEALRRAIGALEARIADLGKAAPTLAASATPVLAVKMELPSRNQQATVIPFPSTSTESVSPEIVVVIAAAVTAFLGKKVRIRSARRLQSPYEIVNPWAQQGRVIVQASHNLLSGPRSERGFTERNSAFEVANRH
jgi:methylmalonyl-CoA carboxyltransferase 12S subunit